MQFEWLVDRPRPESNPYANDIDRKRRLSSSQDKRYVVCCIV
jgi:hypothetical protein